MKKTDGSARFPFRKRREHAAEGERHGEERRMATMEEQLNLFLRKCDELTESSFIIADTKISELLKAIVASDALYAFFRDITKGFDYPAAKRKYMGYTPQGTAQRELLMPEDPAERLAFVFCLLADIDSRAIDLNGFLQQYFHADGSLQGGYYAFCNKVIKPFRSMVKTVLKSTMDSPGATEDAERKKLSALIAAERKEVYLSDLPDTRKADALILLNAANAAGEDPAALAAALCGYLYFSREVRRGSAYAEIEACYESLKEKL